MFMGIKLSSLGWALGLCLFIGVVGLGVGFGAALPSLNNIALPLVCPNGHITSTMKEYTVSPTEHGYTVSNFCVDTITGKETKLGLFPLALYSGLIYGFILFLVVIIIMIVYARKTNKRKIKFAN
jgi:hypothetical protein